MLCFVLYGLVWPWALADSNARQVLGVSLINYLWPLLTVVFSVWWVPGVRLTRRMVLAMAMAIAGLGCANLKPIRELLGGDAGPGGSAIGRLLPYLLALTAAVTWGVYSALLARWRHWAKDYVTSPIGFLLIGAIAGVVAFSTGGFAPRMSPTAAWLTGLYGAGPVAAGYLLWEVALARARVQSLSLIAAATPVLSTVLLCLFLKRVPGWELVAAAFLVSGGVVLSLEKQDPHPPRPAGDSHSRYVL